MSNRELGFFIVLILWVQAGTAPGFAGNSGILGILGTQYLSSFGRGQRRGWSRGNPTSQKTLLSHEEMLKRLKKDGLL